MTNQIHRSLL
uniref:Uncharacterized protein n=1 Tax=Rhizophora mucronata TaxID=61149 RepID=A0A2P2NJU9_RHIMU